MRLNGPVHPLYPYAVICAQVGERDLAIEQLQTLVQIPAGAHYGELLLNPLWDPLRRIRASRNRRVVAPKDAASPTK